MTRSNSSALEPCPFCGATDLLQTDKVAVEYSEQAAASVSAEREDVPEEEWFVVCGDCGTMGPMSPSVEAATAAWNVRI